VARWQLAASPPRLPPRESPHGGCPTPTLQNVEQGNAFPPSGCDAALRTVLPPRAEPDGGERRELTRTGHEALARLVDARRAHLTAALAECQADPELHPHLREFAHDLVPDAPH
jgi:hypothetical protein